MKPLTEKQAWLFIAKEFEKKKQTIVNGLGLCWAVTIIHDRIDAKTYYLMRCRLQALIKKRKNNLEHGRFLWPTTNSNKPKRAKLARRFAKECEG